MLCGTNIIMWNIPYVQSEVFGIFHTILALSQNNVLDLNGYANVRNIQKLIMSQASK